MVQEMKCLGFHIDRELKFNILKKREENRVFEKDFTFIIQSFNSFQYYYFIALHLLQVLQNKAVRVILSSNRETSVDLMLNTLN